MVQVILDGTVEPSASVRVRFKKTGALKYTAHLDLVRTMTKALSRAGIPVRYSEGFNPHPRFSFATAMSIGLESLYEFMDIRIDKPVDPEGVTLALRAALTDECYIEESYFPETKFTDIFYSSYRIEIRTAGASEELAERADALLKAKPLTVFKRSKSGDKDTDISDGIKETRAFYENGAVVVLATLAADNAGFLNPEYLVTYLKESLGVLKGSLLEESYSVMRTGLYMKDMSPFR